MILTRLGNKRKHAHALYQLFPPHKFRVELFFGAGGSFFNMPQPKYAVLNDFDDDVTNLYLTLLNDRKRLEYEIELMPVSETLLKYWLENKEQDPVRKAVRFLLISNFSYIGKGNTLRFGLDNAKKNLLKNIEPTLRYLQNVKFSNCDFREVLPKISFNEKVNPKKNAFVYLDPIYYKTEHYYNVPEWGEKDTLDCLDLMLTCGIKSGMSEFAHPFVIAAAQERELKITPIKERQNIKTRSTEILITNYEPPQAKLF